MQISSVSNSSSFLSAEDHKLIEEIVTSNMKTAELMSNVGTTMLSNALETAEVSSLKVLQGGLDMYI